MVASLAMKEMRMKTKKLNIVTTNEQSPTERMKPKKLDTVTTNKINAAPRSPMKERPVMNADEIIPTGNIEKHQKKNKAIKRMAKARKAKEKK